MGPVRVVEFIPFADAQRGRNLEFDALRSFGPLRKIGHPPGEDLPRLARFDADKTADGSGRLRVADPIVWHDPIRRQRGTAAGTLSPCSA
ncbi:MAG: hypothetical protein F4213_01570 [Boseongicola sp. SB0677_bin_26]|nr:hypothetical protein [Boseongicola sp. SB0677_bin_26]